MLGGLERIDAENKIIEDMSAIIPMQNMIIAHFLIALVSPISPYSKIEARSENRKDTFAAVTMTNCVRAGSVKEKGIMVAMVQHPHMNIMNRVIGIILV